MMAKPEFTRAKQALVGALVADAATMPLHWIYGEEKIDSAMSNKKDAPEFFETLSCPYYTSQQFPGHYSLGQVSPYGEELLCLLNHMAKNGGDFKDPEAFADDLLAWGESFGGRPNSCTKKFIEQRKGGAKYPLCGADDHQSNAIMKAIVITTRYFGKPELYDKVEEAVRTHQDNDIAVLYAQAVARMLERVILGEPLAQALSKPDEGIDSDVVAAYEFSQKNKAQSRWEYIGILGNHLHLENPMYATSCALPAAFLIPMHVMLNNPSFENAVRENIRIGGDNCSRGLFIGALTAAAQGSVPEAWKTKTKDVAIYEKLAEVLLAARKD